MLHQSKIPDIIEKKGKNGLNTSFSFVFVKRSTGEKVRVDEAVCTSSHHAPRTYNVKILESGEIRKVRHQAIIELNDSEIYL